MTSALEQEKQGEGGSTKANKISSFESKEMLKTEIFSDVTFVLPLLCILTAVPPEGRTDGVTRFANGSGASWADGRKA